MNGEMITVRKIKSFPTVFVPNNIPIKLIKNSNDSFELFGDYFTQNTTLFIPNNVITSVQYISAHHLIVNVNVGSLEGLTDLLITNEGGTKVLNNFINIITENWIDLRSGGDTLTIGNAIGNDIRHNSSINIIRDTQGLGVTGVNTDWRDWIKFENLNFQRGDNKTVNIIFTGWSDTIMLGIGSNISNESSTQQFSEMESSLYINTPNSIYGLYGNNGTPGIVASQQQALTGVLNSSQIYKLKITSDGGNGSLFNLYQIHTGSPVDWNDESTLIYSITSNLTPSQLNLIPTVLPRKLGFNGRLIAIK